MGIGNTIALSLAVTCLPAVQKVLAQGNVEQWNFDVIDIGIDSTEPCIRIDSQDYPHISYIRKDTATGDITVVYAYYSGSGWVFSTIDETEYNSIPCRLALDENDEPAVVYTKGDTLFYATQGSGGGWDRSPMYICNPLVVVFPSDLDIAPDGDPRVVFSEFGGSGLAGKHYIYAVCNGVSWELDTLMSYGEDQTILRISMVIEQDNTVHLADSRYYGFERFFYHGELGEGGWQWDYLEGYDGYDPDIELSGIGLTHIAFLDDYQLHMATYDGSFWSYTMVDSTRHHVYRCALAIDASDLDHIAYYDSESYNTNKLLYAWGSGSSWNTMGLDTVGNAGMYPDIALDDSGNPFIAYWHDDSESLKLAWYGDPTGFEHSEQGDSCRGVILSIAPNPASHTMNIEIAYPGDGPINVSLFDLQGRLVLESDRIDCPGGVSVICEDISALSSGIYLVSVSGCTTTDFTRLTVIR